MSLFFWHCKHANDSAFQKGRDNTLRCLRLDHPKLEVKHSSKNKLLFLMSPLVLTSSIGGQTLTISYHFILPHTKPKHHLSEQVIIFSRRKLLLGQKLTMSMNIHTCYVQVEDSIVRSQAVFHQHGHSEYAHVLVGVFDPVFC